MSTPTEQAAQRAGPVGGVGRRVTPPPRSLVWEVWEVWRIDGWLGVSARLEVRGLGGALL